MKKLKIFVVLGLMICALTMVATGCDSEEIDRPSGCTVDETNLLSWDSVDEAGRYIVSIINSNNGKITETVLRKTSLSLSELEEGDYEIKVKAVGRSDSKLESDWSETLYFHKDYETGCVYKLVNNSEYQIVTVGSASGDVILEDIYRGKPVTEICDNAFKNNGTVESIVIGNNVTTIGDSAFYKCAKLMSVTIPESVTTIGSSAFGQCSSLTTITIPESVSEISDYMFSYCRSLQEVVFSSNITSVGKEAFISCTKLKEVVIPDSVTSIEESAFLRCTAMTDVKFGRGLETIGDYAFLECVALTNVTFSSSGNLGSIGDRAFAYCSFSEIELPNSLKNIESGAFLSAGNLEHVTIPDSVTRIGENAFNATKIYKTALDAGETFIYADKWLVSCTAKEELVSITADMFRADTVGIADQVFLGCPKLENVTFSESMKYVGNYAFSYNYSLWRVRSYDDSLVSIGKGAFLKCEKLSHLLLGDGLKTIGAYSFYGCSLLDNSTLAGSSLIPESVTSIGSYAFKNTKLWLSPDESGVIYAGNWVVGSEGGNSTIVLKESTVGIADYAFYAPEVDGFITSYLESVTGLRYVKHIGRGAFYNCINLSTIVLNDELKEIGDYAFYNCRSLAKVTLPANLTSIGRSSFYGCCSIYELDLSDTLLKSIDDYAFAYCTNLKEIALSDMLKGIGEYAFYQCENLLGIELSDSVTDIGDHAFQNCSRMKEVVIPDSVTSIGNHVFQGCLELGRIVIPDSVTSIGNYSFYNCIGVKELILGNGVQTIGRYAFSGMSNLEQITLSATVNRIEKYAFKNCRSLTSIFLGEVEEIQEHAFYGCDTLTVYISAEVVPVGWDKYWNAYRCPVVYGCTLSEDGAYVVSVTIKEDTFANILPDSLLSAPSRAGYTFCGWATTRDANEAEYLTEDITNVSVGSVLYAVWKPIEEIVS